MIHDIIDEIHYRWLGFSHAIREFFRSIKMVLSWLPVIWRDRWWDEGFFWRILKFKLEQMERGHSQRGNLECSLETARGLRECIKIVSRLTNEEEYYYEKGTWDNKQKDINTLFDLMKEKVTHWSD